VPSNFIFRCVSVLKDSITGFARPPVRPSVLYVGFFFENKKQNLRKRFPGQEQPVCQFLVQKDKGQDLSLIIAQQEAVGGVMCRHWATCFLLLLLVHA